MIDTHCHLDDEQYKDDIDEVIQRAKNAGINKIFVPGICRKDMPHLINICKQHHTAIRIGVNHGSLSQRIMNQYGDTPEGMVASCMEFLRIAVQEDFHDIVLSIKASNTRIMVETVRLLVRTMDAEKMAFP